MPSVDERAAQLKAYNRAYRAGHPQISDHEYDQLVEALRQIDPTHPFLHQVEPEAFTLKREVSHPAPMLSTEKAYRKDQLARFLSRIQKKADELGIADISFEVTPKLDGLAGRDDGQILASRGNGRVGYDISHVFDRGVVPIGGRGQGVGEIVIQSSYFLTHMADNFEHPRNMVVGIAMADTVNEAALQALNDHAVHFVPYGQLPSWHGSAEDLLAHIDRITTDLAQNIDYPIDGMVAAVNDETLRTALGATEHHYRWQIAIKTRGETALTRVCDITWQVGRTGNVTPVLTVDPVSLSGATIRRVTGHNAGMIERLRIGPGAEIEIIRSGEVIPKLEKVIRPSSEVALPTHCPTCDRALVRQNDFLKCDNPQCHAQIERHISHWFKTLGNADWFGIKTIQKLVAGGFDSLQKIYSMAESDFVELGFGPVQSKNLMQALMLSRRKKIEDWRFLAAFGIADLGMGDSRKLLARHALDSLIRLDVADIEKLHGFGAITSRTIIHGLQANKELIAHMMTLGFSIELTQQADQPHTANSAVSGKRIVFTGKMMHGAREKMADQARKLGAAVQTAVSGKTDMLVCGENVGQVKIEKARRLGVMVLAESEYIELLNTGQ